MQSNSSVEVDVPEESETTYTTSLPIKKATVLVVGESQAGKSTFIQKLYELAGQTPPLSLITGDGVSSTTDRTIIYPITFRLQGWRLRGSDPETRVDVQGVRFNRRKFFQLAHNGELEISKAENYTPFELTLIDTPGLKGNDYSEAEHMNNMLRIISSLKEVNSVILLEGGDSYGPTLKSTLEYYQNLIGRGSIFDVFHTKYTTDMHLSFLKEEIKKGTLTETGPSKESHYPVHPREAKFYNDFNGWQHWFIDSCPMEEFKFREWLFHSTMVEWIISLSTKIPIPVSNLQFYKTDEMLAIDKIVIASNNAKLDGYLNGLTEQQSLSDKVLIQVSETEKNRQKKKAEIADCNDFLTIWDTEDEVSVGNDRVAPEWKWFRGQEVDMTVKSTDRIMVIRKAIYAESKCWFDEETQTSHGEGHNCRSYTIKIKSNAFRGCYASITAYTYRKIKKSDEIQLKKERRKRAEKELAEIERNAREYSNQVSEVVEAIEKLKLLSIRYTQANERIQKKTISFKFHEILEEENVYENFSKYSGDRHSLENLNDLYCSKYY